MTELQDKIKKLKIWRIVFIFLIFFSLINVLYVRTLVPDNRNRYSSIGTYHFDVTTGTYHMDETDTDPGYTKEELMKKNERAIIYFGLSVIFTLGSSLIIMYQYNLLRYEVDKFIDSGDLDVNVLQTKLTEIKEPIKEEVNFKFNL